MRFDAGSGPGATLVARRVVVRHNDAGRNAVPFMVRYGLSEFPRGGSNMAMDAPGANVRIEYCVS